MNDDSQAEEVRRVLERAQFYLECGLTADAVRHLEDALALAPGDASVRAALARIRPQPAKPGRVFDIKSPPPPGAAADDLSAAYAAAYRARNWAGAADAARTLTQARPDDARAWNSLAVVARRLGNFEMALDAHDRAVALSSAAPGAALARAKTLWEAGRLAEADAAYGAQLSKLDEGGAQYADTRMSQGMIRMTLDGPAAGIEDYEWRWRSGQIALPEVGQPYWDGTPQPDKRILLYGEQGFGDAIQFARYVPLIAARCARVVMPCKPEIRRLMETLPGAPEVCGEKISRDSFDLYVPAMSAMRLLGADLDALPRDVPYLRAAEDDIARLRPRIEGGGRLRVGIAWTGSPTNGGDWKRAIDPALFEVLARVPGVTLYSLQKARDDTPEPFRRLPEGTVDLASMLNDFADTAAAIACLDLVVSADTSVAHLAGALAKPVWVMLPKVPDWRWMLGRDDSPWYPTMRLYRQDAFGDWPGVMARVASNLAGFEPKARKKTRGLTRLLPWRR
ncbi:tetratricopeptide repeat protein [Thalassospiraceae bacterium LMO-SO8]|nr:tetratricopeptide repeat protein [Alphaproteobacteria bacterium LMO-S08]WND75421.1 tetratricopeptide repeat protein [Thalassospiraceae bacterium LMO-SO8]